MMADGVASPSAHGQAITSTATALTMACSHPAPAIIQPVSVTSAAASTTGTKTALTRSTSCWIGGLAACASSTRRMMRESMVSAPMAVVRTSSTPSAAMAPAVTWSPARLGTGRLSPVSIDWSTWLAPSTTVPSTGMRSPARTETASPTRTRAMGTSRSVPSAPRTRAVSGRNACNARMAWAVCRLARASSHLPSRTSVMTTAALSKYRCGISPASARHHSHNDSP